MTKTEINKITKIFDGRKCYYKHPDGTEEWYQDGRLHRDAGPAIIYSSGGEEWCQHGKRHRDDGPAVISANGAVEWWHNGRKLPAVTALSRRAPRIDYI